ncbi:MAG: hypothetical protein KKD29_04795 [Candidatus Omnitrophica bacterium]|nr:hypothetical protein [Candidatus Omnitrophota bacterium]MBU4488658.1 hypothetical protein [Candidatus Omnitrophota bacterium]MCG2705236.1 hypothetical protein [Candidatus Omnitrophota bacterium]
MKRIPAIYFTFLIILAVSGLAFSEEITAGEDGAVISASYATIYVAGDVDLKSVVRKIDVDFARYDPVEKEIMLKKGISTGEQLANKIDILTRKVRKVLDMYPQGFKVNIRIYKNAEDLKDAYKGIFEEEADHKAFYIYKFNTIYISMDDLSESILSHEIGHAVIDNYFNVLPPAKIRELLACYVELHLRD